MFRVHYTISGQRSDPDIKINNIHLCVTENPGCWWERSRLFVDVYDVVDRMSKGRYRWSENDKTEDGSYIVSIYFDEEKKSIGQLIYSIPDKSVKEFCDRCNLHKGYWPGLLDEIDTAIRRGEAL